MAADIRPEPATAARFVTFEGGEGAGKSTQIRALERHLLDSGIKCIVTREPGGTPGAEAIRSLLVTGDPDRWDAMTEALLNTAARRDHAEKIIWPALADNTWVLCDRFADSTLAYQGKAGGLGFDGLRRLYEYAVGEQQPDLTIIMDVPVEIGLSRAGKRSGPETRFEQHEQQFHEDVRAAFLEIADAEPGRCAVIDATRPKEDVSVLILKIVEERLLRDG